MAVHYLNQFVEEQLVSTSEDSKDSPAKLKEARKRISGMLYKEGYVTSKENVGYQTLSSEFPEVSSYVRCAMSHQVFKHYQADFAEVAKGNKTQRSYKRGMPIPFVSKSMQNITEEGFTWCKHPLIFVYGKDMSGNRKLIQRILSDSVMGCEDPKELYTISDSSFKLIGKKLFLYLCVNVPNKEAGLKKSVTALVDITFKCPIIISSNANKKTVSVGNPEHLLALRTQMNRRMSQLQSSFAHNGGSNGSRKGKMEGLWSQLHKKQHDIANTENHKITKHVINEVIRMKARHMRIKVNKQAELPENIKNYLIPYFDYGMITEKLVYKAKQHGIEVEIVEVEQEAA